MYCASFVGIPSSCQVLLFFSSRPSSKGKRKEKKNNADARGEKRVDVCLVDLSISHRSLTVQDSILIGRNGIFLCSNEEEGEDKNGPRNIASYHWNLYRSADRARGAFPVAYQAWRRKIQLRFTKISRFRITNCTLQFFHWDSKLVNTQDKFLN